MIKLTLFHNFSLNNIKEWRLTISSLYASCLKIVPWSNPTLILLLQRYSKQRLRIMHLDTSNVLYFEFGNHCASAIMFFWPLFSCNFFCEFLKEMLFVPNYPIESWSKIDVDVTTDTPVKCVRYYILGSVLNFYSFTIIIRSQKIVILC